MKSTFWIAIAIAGVLGWAIFAAIWFEHSSAVMLPHPTGPYAVGRSIYDWADQPGTHREVLVWIWYPAAHQQRRAAADYIPDPMRTAIARDTGPLANLLERDPSKVHTNSLRDADVSPRERAYPVILLRGGASREVAGYTVLAEDLASHGYVVVGFDAPYRTFAMAFPDGRVANRLREDNIEICAEKGEPERSGCANRILHAWTADMSFVTGRLQQLNADPSQKFSGRLDLTKLGAFGHSFGGAEAAQFCHDDARCKAGIDIDGLLFGNVPQNGIRQPFLFILSDQIESRNAEAHGLRAQLQSIAKQNLVIRGANHYFFSDDALLKSQIVIRVLRALGVVRIDGRRELSIAAYLVRSFFDAYLKGEGNSEMDAASGLYPEVHRLT